MRQVSARQVRWYRLRASGLIDPFCTMEEASSALVGIQAQILPAAGLSLAHRVAGLSDAVFQEALWDERRLVKIWSQRGTLHVFPTDDWAMITGAQAHKRGYYERKFIQAGGTPEAFREIIDAVADLMKEKGTICRADLRDAPFADSLSQGMLSSWGGVFYSLVRRGLACHAARSGSEGLFAYREHWLPALADAWEPPGKDEANQEVARRYFRTYGPSTLKDFAYWRGASLRDARPWVEAISSELVPVSLAGEELWIHEDGFDALLDKPPPASRWPLVMLYRFDPLLLGHKDKGWLVPAAYYSQVWRKAGHIEGTILEEGRISGTWRYHRNDRRCNLVISPFEGYSEEIEDVIMDKAVSVASFFDLPCEEVEFVAPIAS